jgi:hypothetical protein
LRRFPDPDPTRRLRRPGFQRFVALGARLRGDRSRWGLAAVAILLIALGLVPIALSGAGLMNVAALPTAPPTAPVTPEQQAQATPTEPAPTPAGTPAPKPSEALDTGASATVSPPPPPTRATSTPTPQPGLWRVEGYVVDESGNPLKNVCVVVGPHGCQRFSPHTDERGHYFLDVAASTTIKTAFDFYFEMPGRETVWWQFVPSGPIEFNVVLKPSN